VYRCCSGGDPAYRALSLVRRNTMEIRQHAGRTLVAREAERLRAVAQAANEDAATLRLDPQLTDDPMLDRLYGVTLALITELAVTRTRLDTVEKMLARRELVAGEEIEDFTPDDSEAAARSRLQAEYLDRVLRSLD